MLENTIFRDLRNAIRTQARQTLEKEEEAARQRIRRTFNTK